MKHGLKNEKLEVVGEVEIMLMYAVSTAARIKNSFLLGKLEVLTVSLPSKPSLVGFQSWWAGRRAQLWGPPWLSQALELFAEAEGKKTGTVFTGMFNGMELDLLNFSENSCQCSKPWGKILVLLKEYLFFRLRSPEAPSICARYMLSKHSDWLGGQFPIQYNHYLLNASCEVRLFFFSLFLTSCS